MTDLKNRLELFETFYHILDQWLFLKSKGKTISNFFIDNKYSDIAVYGMGNMAMHLIDELESNNIKLKCAIDKEKNSYYTTIPIYSISEQWPAIDVIVVTDKREMSMLIKRIQEKEIKCDVVTLENVVYWEF